MTKKKTHDEFNAEFTALANGEYSLLSVYQTTHIKVEVKHEECGTIYEVSPAKFLSGRRCPKCQGKRISKTKQKQNDLFLEELKRVRGEDFQPLQEYKGAGKRIEVLHAPCAKSFEVTPNNLISNKSGCPHCYGNFTPTTEDFINSVEKTYSDRYEVLGEYVNNRVKVKVKHRPCGFEWSVIPKDFLKGHGCPKCQSSKGEEFIRGWLTSKDVRFEEQVRFKDCRNKRPLPFDFLVWFNDDEFALIEFDGSQHFGKSNYWGGASSLDKVKLHDEIKNIYCESNGIKLLRIPHWWLRSKRIYRELENLLKV